ncbi:MBL fold metallo-hydrolase [Natranaerofaba carboxydovora]|uniref:MBL fold metallo-hydrolase n=1 Tax=Natranaerofaba carboxydovora TaxID=2742683 RepID=UPI001F14412A|nr:MBL fold metallo-hydrolase [Natranaerofaba carboxydovora]UMZ74932.1 Metallo-beta-lactamase superfamily protein [Natranaerofaba carboxydovora]
MKELMKGVFILPGDTNIGLITKDGYGLMIDSYREKSARDVIKFAFNNGIEIKGVITTHAHVDHFGGHDFLFEKGVEIISSPIEEAVVKYPILGTMGMSHGVYPLSFLQNEHFLADKPVPVDRVLEQGEHELFGIRFELFDLPGHTLGQIGVLFKDAFFIADSLFCPKRMASHKVPFHKCIERELDTLDFLEKTNYRLYVPSHGDPMTKYELDKMIDLNRKIIQEIEVEILEFLDRPRELFQIYDYIFEKRNMHPPNGSLYFLLQNTILSYLSHLERKGDITTNAYDRKLYWQRNTNRKG